MSENKFRPRKFEDHVIDDANGRKVGQIRVTPTGIWWAPNSAQKWYCVDLKSFADFMEQSKTREARNGE